MRLARDMDVNISFIECMSPIAVLKDRLKKREDKATVSDARLHHFNELKNRFEPLDDIAEEIHIRIDTQRPMKENIVQILSHDYGLLSKEVTGG